MSYDTVPPDVPPPTSLWASKPWWCQPWSIILTGILLPGAVWVLTQRLWLTLPLVGIVFIWWTLFLYLAPKQYAEALQATQARD
jgi:hypothetical protein